MGINFIYGSSLSLSDSYAFEPREGSFVVSDLSQSLHCLFIYTRDGGTLPDQVPGLRVRDPDSYPIVTQSLMLQNWHRVLVGWIHCAITSSIFYFR